MTYFIILILKEFSMIVHLFKKYNKNQFLVGLEVSE